MKEKKAFGFNGFYAVILIIVLVITAFLVFKGSFVLEVTEGSSAMVPSLLGVLTALLFLISAGILSAGLVVVQPNEAIVLVFFGKYLGTIRKDGFYVTVPAVRKKVSLRVKNFNSETLKVNDIHGNPVEIAAVIVYKVVDSAKALFDVDGYEGFVRIQSETALRHVATKYPYDAFEDDGISLRGNAEEVADELARELHERLQVAGVEIIEARLTHLAYSPEIAQAMLQRQQANAIVSARKKIVEGAVGMVEDALLQLDERKVVTLSEEQKAQMVSNLMVAIVSEKGTQPVMQAGSIK